MTDKYQRIRNALSMGPTPGPFFVSNGSDVFTLLGATNAQGTHSDEDDGWHVADCFGGETYVNGELVPLTYSESKANAHLFAACDPDTIRGLLAERDALQAECERLREKVGLIICDECHAKCSEPYTGLFASQRPDEEPCIMCECRSLRRQLASRVGVPEGWKLVPMKPPPASVERQFSEIFGAKR